MRDRRLYVCCKEYIATVNISRQHRSKAKVVVPSYNQVVLPELIDIGGENDR